MTLKTAAASFGNGLLAIGSAMHNGALQGRIDEIDAEVAVLQEQIDELQKERANLVARQF